MEENLVEEAVTEYFGERCPEYEPGCACCEGWKQYDVMRAYALGVLWTIEELSKLELAHVNLIKNHALPMGDGGWLVPHKR